MTDRYFTLDEARRLVPWLKETFEAIAPLRDKANRLNAGIRELAGRMRGNGGGESYRRLRHLRRELRETSDLIDERTGEIHGRGILVKGIDPGLVDFPSQREGQAVYLCWLEGESELEFWHEIDAGFAGRQPL